MSWSTGWGEIRRLETAQKDSRSGREIPAGTVVAIVERLGANRVRVHNPEYGVIEVDVEDLVDRPESSR